MIRYKWFRWIKCMLGSRSFTNVSNDGTTTHCIITGKDPRYRIAIQLFELGYTEEWPRNSEGLNTKGENLNE